MQASIDQSWDCFHSYTLGENWGYHLSFSLPLSLSIYIYMCVCMCVCLCMCVVTATSLQNKSIFAIPQTAPAHPYKLFAICDRQKTCPSIGIKPVHYYLTPQIAADPYTLTQNLTQISCMLLRKDLCEISLRLFVCYHEISYDQLVHIWTNRTYCRCSKHIQAEKYLGFKAKCYFWIALFQMKCSILHTSNALQPS